MATRTTATKTTKTTKAATKAPAAKAKIVEEVKPIVTDAPIKKPELVDRVIAETGMKKKDVKPVVEATLAVLSKALLAGEDLTVPPLGKLMIKRSKEISNATVLNLKLRHSHNISADETQTNESDVV